MRDALIAEMKRAFGEDARRIDHALAVLGYAEALLEKEPADREVVVAAAILHDIGIQAAEVRHGSSAGNWQEVEGPPIARPILQRLGMAAERLEHVCQIIANHHSARDIDTPEFRIIWDADWLVNIPDEFPNATVDELTALIKKVFRTPKARQMACRDLLP